MYIYIFHNHNKYRNSFRLRKTKKKCKKINNTKREYIQKTRMKNIAASTNVILFTFLLRDQKNVYKETIIDESIDFERFLNGRRNKQKKKMYNSAR